METLCWLMVGAFILWFYKSDPDDWASFLTGALAVAACAYIIGGIK